MKQVKQTGSTEFPLIKYAVYGAGEAIVLLHGFPFDHMLWEPVAKKLSDKYCVIVPDLPGGGRSKPADDILTIENLSEAVIQVLDAENVEKAVVAGHSMGGYVAMVIAELFAERVKGIGMIHSTAAADSEDKRAIRQKSIELFKKGGGAPFIRQMVPGLFAESNKQRQNSEIEQVISRALLTDSNSLIAFYKAMMDRSDRIGILHNSKLPFLWVLGEEDGILSTKNLIQQTSLSNVNFVYIYNNCGHMSMIESPNELADNISSFAAYCWEVEVGYVE